MIGKVYYSKYCVKEWNSYLGEIRVYLGSFKIEKWYYRKMFIIIYLCIKSKFVINLEY